MSPSVQRGFYFGTWLFQYKTMSTWFVQLSYANSHVHSYTDEHNVPKWSGVRNNLDLLQHSHSFDQVFGVVAPEVVPALVVAAAQETGCRLVIYQTAAVVDVRKVVVNGANVTEMNVLLGLTFASCSGHRRHHAALGHWKVIEKAHTRFRSTDF